MRRTKLVCTIGPASRPRLDELVAAGMDVARLNFSHGTDAEHAAALDAVRRHAVDAGRTVAALADLPGPKVRLGEIGERELEVGATVRLTPPGGEDLPITYPGLAGDVVAGDRLLLADGAVELRVAGHDGGAVTADVVRGGTVRSGTGLNVPSERLSLPAVPDRDRRALGTILDLGVDFVAQSFVRRAADVTALRELMGERAVPIVAKLETRAAIDHLDDILSVADAVMLARGDLGVELPYAQVPIIQKRVIAACAARGVPVIVATQMLESMTRSPRPTRAEASDVANAVLEGADAVMLSAETAIGDHPVAAARAAVEIAETAERDGPPIEPPDHHGDAREPGPAAIAAAAVDLVRHAADPPIAAIACFTRTGLTARLLSARRPPRSIFALSPDEAVVRRLALWRAVEPVHVTAPSDTDELVALVEATLRGIGLPAGALVVISGSIPFGAARTNFLKLHRLA